MGFTLKIVFALIVAAGVGAAAVYFVKVDNHVVVQPPAVAPAPVGEAPVAAPPRNPKTREELAREYRSKAGSQQDLPPSSWGDVPMKKKD